MAHSGPFVRGIYLTLHAFLPDGAIALSQGRVSTWYRESYAGRPFVRMFETPPELTHAVGTNYALMYAAQSPDGKELQVSVAIDNLVKGAGGQAIQAMNLALGLDECAGLTSAPPYPC
jgi:N-acetyl-gamma-glutamyl-phosphate reductase